MDINLIKEGFEKKAANADPLGAKVKFQLDDLTIHIDGTGAENVVSMDDKEADCVISSTMDNFAKLQSGKLNPMMAMMMGKIKVKGDMGVAMKLQSLL